MSSIGSTPSLVVGVGVGAALSAALEPALEVPKQKAWADAPNRLPDVGLIAELVAGGKVTLADGRAMAKRLGFDQGPFDSLTWLAQNRLDFPAMLRLWRRFGAFDSGAKATLDKLVDETLAHETLDWDYQPWLKKMYDAELVGLGSIATGVQRGALPAPSYMPVVPPTSGLSVQRFPQVQLDPEVLAEALGFDKDMLHLMIAQSGLSLAPIFAANAFFRGIINDQDFLLAIAEGDLRTEWAETLKEAAREIPTVGQMMEHSLRGFEDVASAKTNAKRHGMVEADSQLVYDNMGRAPNVHAVTTGLARGAQYPGDYSMVPEPYKSAIQRSDIRPEFADVVYHDRYTYPSAFVLRSLAQAGDLGGQQAVEQVLLEIGWKPSFATQVSTAWTGGTTATDPILKSEQTRLRTATHKAYVASEISAATATTALKAAGVPAASVPGILAIWDEEKSLVRKSLSAAQIKKAWHEQLADPALGRPWTEAEAVTRLQELGYSADGAKILLTE